MPRKYLFQERWLKDSTNQERVLKDKLDKLYSRSVACKIQLFCVCSLLLLRWSLQNLILVLTSPYKVLIWLQSNSLGTVSGHSGDWVDSCKKERQKKRFSFGAFSDSASRSCDALPADFQGTDFPSSLLVFCRHLHSPPSAELLALTDNPPFPPPSRFSFSFFFLLYLKKKSLESFLYQGDPIQWIGCSKIKSKN